MARDTRAEINFKFMEMMKLLNVYLNHFPKHEKFALALQIRQTAYRVFDLIVEWKLSSTTVLSAKCVALRKERVLS